MCNLSKGIEEKGIAIGIEKGIAQGIEKGIEKGYASALRGLMETLNVSVEQAMAMLKIPTAERPKIMELLEQ